LSNDFDEIINLDVCAGFIEMELAEYGDLLEILSLQNTPLPEKVVKYILKPIVQELKILHENGFAHRDVRPENILIKGNLISCLTDFGYTVKTEEGITVKDCSFCYNYAAPELLFGDDIEPDYDAIKADMFSLGKTLLTLISMNGFIDRKSK
jgi:serine/threonine protein kinase